MPSGSSAPGVSSLSRGRARLSRRDRLRGCCGSLGRGTSVWVRQSLEMPRPGCPAQCFGNCKPAVLFRDPTVRGHEPSPVTAESRAWGNGRAHTCWQSLEVAQLPGGSLHNTVERPLAVHLGEKHTRNKPLCEDAQGSIICNTEKVKMSSLAGVLSS